MLTTFIMAGGIGERFWPLSTKERQKQLLKLVSEKTMIRETIDRILPSINYFLGSILSLNKLNKNNYNKFLGNLK